MKKILKGLDRINNIFIGIVLPIHFIYLGLNLLINGKFLFAKFSGAAGSIFFGGLLLYGAYKKIKSAKS